MKQSNCFARMAIRMWGIILAVALITATIPGEPPVAQAAPSEATLDAAYKAYYEVLKAAVDEHGIGGNPGEVGAAGLIDFDNDGMLELVFAIETGELGPDIHVYGYTGSSVLLFYRGSATGDAFRGADVSFATGNEGTTYISEFRKSYIDDSTKSFFREDAEFQAFESVLNGYHDITNYYTVRNNQWVSELILTRNVDLRTLEPFEWFVNNVPVSKQDYNNAPEIELGITDVRYIEHGANPASVVEATLAELQSRQVKPSTPTLSTGITVLLNGVNLSFDQPPIIENGRTLVPLRAIFEALGAKVDWDESTQTVTAVKDGITITLRIGSDVLIRNGVNIHLDVPARIAGGRTMVPARAIAESFGADVGWEQNTQTVTITLPTQDITPPVVTIEPPM